MVKSHCLGKPLDNGEFQKVNYTVQKLGECGEFVAGEVGQYIFGSVIVKRPANSYPHPYKLVTGQFLQQGAETVMAGVPAPFFKFYPPEGDVKIIVNDDEVLNGKLMEMKRLGHGTPGEVHECLGFQEKQPFPLKRSLTIKTGEIFPGYRNSDIMAKSVQNHETRVMAGP